MEKISFESGVEHRWSFNEHCESDDDDDGDDDELVRER